MKYVALLRGINVGGNNKISMTDLKQSVTSCGFTNVVSYINSGNIVFNGADRQPAEIVEMLEEVINRDFGLGIKVLLRSKNEFEAIIDALPAEWTNDAVRKSDVMFLWEEIDTPTVVDALPANIDVDEVLYLPGALLWSVRREDATQSGQINLVRSSLYKKMTVRNVNTVRKLWELIKL